MCFPVFPFIFNIYISQIWIFVLFVVVFLFLFGLCLVDELSPLRGRGLTSMRAAFQFSSSRLSSI